MEKQKTEMLRFNKYLTRINYSSQWIKSVVRVHIWFILCSYLSPFPRQECWNGLPFPSPEDLPDPAIKPWSPALQPDASPSEAPGEPLALPLECTKCPGYLQNGVQLPFLAEEGPVVKRGRKKVALKPSLAQWVWWFEVHVEDDAWWKLFKSEWAALIQV